MDGDTQPFDNASEPKRVSVLGATGSIGRNTLDIISRTPEAYDVIALTARDNVEQLASDARRLGARFAVVGDEKRYRDLKAALGGSGVEPGAGDEALVEAGAREADWVMAAIMGAAGLEPTFEAVRQGRTVAIANKECLVAAGDYFMDRAEAFGTALLPVDSEHSAAFQALDGSGRESLEKITLTASGGPFRTWDQEALAKVRPAEALKHPNWSMGAKLTIDSATLMNKGLELIEARHLFGVAPDQLDVVVHPQSIVHCLVHYRDGSVLAQLAMPDMRCPIAYSLSYPGRISTPVERLDLAQVGRLDFEPPDLARFPALALAQEAMRTGGVACTVLNAANEVAVAAFLRGELGFLGIARLVGDTLARFKGRALSDAPADIGDALSIDAEARTLALGLLGDEIS